MHFFRLASTVALFALSRDCGDRKGCHLPTTRLLQSATDDATTTVDATTTTSSNSSSTAANKYDDLLTWLKNNNDAEVSNKIKLGPSSRGGGYGAFVTEAVEKDELLFTVPRSACITLQNVKDDSSSGKVFERLMEKAGPGGNTVVMAGFMAKERLKALQDAKQGKEATISSFGPYLATLPWERGVNNQEHILYWSDEDIESYLKESMCYDEALALRGEVNVAINVLDSIVGRSVREYRGEIEGGFRWPWEALPELPGGLAEGLGPAIKGAFVSLLTRSFQDGDSDEEKMVPLLDMLQHCDEPNVSHVMLSGDYSVQVRARRPLAAGEELLNQYRSELEESMPYHRFFTRFGFVPGIDEPVPNLLRDKSSIFFAQKATI